MLTNLRLILPYFKARLDLYEQEEGQTVVEYALMLVLVALAVALMAPDITSTVVAAFSSTNSALSSRTTAAS